MRRSLDPPVLIECEKTGLENAPLVLDSAPVPPPDRGAAGGALISSNNANTTK